MSTDRLNVGGELKADQILQSSNGEYYVAMQGDGNLVIRYADGRLIWARGTEGHPGAKLVLQGDGNVVIYDAANVALWASSTVGTSGVELVMQNDANLVLYTATGAATWASGTVRNLHQLKDRIGINDRLPTSETIQSANGRFTLQMQGDGNLVLSETGGKPIWATGTVGSSGAGLVLQDDGNAVIYNSQNQPVWASNTVGRRASEFVLNNDANLVLYAADGTKLWESGSVRDTEGNRIISLPTARDLPLGWDIFIGAASSANPLLFIAINGARGVAAALGVTIGIGPQLAAGALLGGSLGAGVCAFSNGRLGLYGSAAVVAGAVVSVSATWQITFIKNPRENFSGDAMLVGIGGGEVVVGNGGVLLKPGGAGEGPEFLGITCGFGVGEGIPVELYLGAQRTWTLNK